MTDREFLIMRIISVGMATAIVILWTQNSVLQRKVDACWWEIGVANSSIGYADDQLNSAHKNAWSDYQTMGYELSQLDGSYDLRPNPCNKNFSGDLKNYPRQ